MNLEVIATGYSSSIWCLCKYSWFVKNVMTMWKWCADNWKKQHFFSRSENSQAPSRNANKQFMVFTNTGLSQVNIHDCKACIQRSLSSWINEHWDLLYLCSLFSASIQFSVPYCDMEVPAVCLAVSTMDLPLCLFRFSCGASLNYFYFKHFMKKLTLLTCQSFVK